MYKKLLQDKERLSKQPNSGQFLLRRSHQFLLPLLENLDKKLDARLVRTFLDTFLAILSFRNKSLSLVLSELGGYICGFKKAAAGTKRISNLLRSLKWTHQDIKDFRLQEGQQRWQELRQKGKRVLMLWDDGVLEKPESWFSEGLCSVNSSKAKRLTRIKPGYYHNFKKRISVPGFKWSAIVITAWKEKPSAIMMEWWTTRGKNKDWADNVFYKMLKTMAANFGNLVVHVFDRGYASLANLERLWKFNQHFIMRWKKNHNLLMYNGLIKKTHLVSRSYKPKSFRTVWDKERKKNKRISVNYAPVFHPEHPEQPLFLIIVRDKNSYTSPMYIITNLHIDSCGMAWEVVFNYMQRWSIEQTFRFMKTELGIESIRVWFFESRLKLLAILSLVYDFIIRLTTHWKSWAKALSNTWCHRTGKRHQTDSVSLSRFRHALALVLLSVLFQNSG